MTGDFKIQAFTHRIKKPSGQVINFYTAHSPSHEKSCTKKLLCICWSNFFTAECNRILAVHMSTAGLIVIGNWIRLTVSKSKPKSGKTNNR